jgi:putative transposase
MSRSASPSCQRFYGLAMVCRLWKASRATLYRQRPKIGQETVSPGRRGPVGAGSDAELLVKIRKELETSPFTGEGYRKIWARLRFQGVRTAARRVLRTIDGNVA